jgi:hypothetical protein
MKVLFFIVFLATTLVLLNWWTFFRTIAAKYTAVPLLWFQNGFTAFALIEELTSVSWHFLYFLMPAVWASDF